MDNENELPICRSCDYPIAPDELIYNVEGEDLCEQCAWEQLMRLPKSEILKEFYAVRPSRRNNADKKDRIF